MTRIIVGICAVFSAMALARVAHAQTLDPTTWGESIQIKVGDHLTSIQGMDDLLPEPLTNSTTEHGYELTGNLTFGPPGPPQITAHCEGRRDSTTQVSEASTTSDGSVSFRFRVIERATPPVSVTSVPVIVHVQGTVMSEGSPQFCDPICFYDVAASAYSHFVLGDSDSGLIVDLTRLANLTGPPAVPSAAFDTTFTHSITPGIIVSGSQQVQAHVSVELGAVDDWAKADAFVSQSFGISDDLIPGTSSKYSDYYEIEYGAGYWALGNPIPVQKVTWGQMKSRYSRP